MKISTQKSGIAILRIITGLLMLYHGLELFDSSRMDEYLKWDIFKNLPVPEIFIYTGKLIEFIGGIF